MRNGTYLVQVVDTSFAAVIVQYNGWLLVLSFAHGWLSVFCAEEKNILAPLRYIGDSCVTLCEGEDGGQDGSLPGL